MFTKPMTLTAFIHAEMKKYHIEENSKNLKKLRNKLNYLLSTDPLLKKEKSKITPIKHSKDTRGKLYPASFWNKVEKNKKFSLYALKCSDPTYGYADLSWFVKYLENNIKMHNYVPTNLLSSTITPAENTNKIEINPVFGKTKIKNEINITYILLTLIFSKLYPHQHIDINKIQDDLETIENSNTNRNDYIQAYTNLTNLTNYLVSETNDKKYLEKKTEISPRYLLKQIKK